MKKQLIHYNQFLETLFGTVRIGEVAKGTILKSHDNKIALVVETPIFRTMIIKKVVFENNDFLFMPFQDMTLMTQDGGKKARFVKKGDYIQFKNMHYLNTKRNARIEWENDFNTYALPIKVPTENSNELSFFMGCYAVRGVYKNQLMHDKNDNEYYQPTSIEFEFNLKDKHIIDEISTVIKKCFNVTKVPKAPLTAKDNFKLTLNSVNIMKWVKQEMSDLRIIRRTPKFIRMSSLQMRLEFLRGLSAAAYLDKTTKVLFSNSSYMLILYAQHLMRSLGYGTSVAKKTTKTKKGSSTVYCLNILFKHKDAIIFPLLKPLWKLEDVKEDYHTMHKNKIMLQSKIDGDTNNFYFLKVKKVELVETNMYEIETSAEDGFPISNMVII